MNMWLLLKQGIRIREENKAQPYYTMRSVNTCGHRAAEGTVCWMGEGALDSSMLTMNHKNTKGVTLFSHCVCISVSGVM